MNEKFVWNVTYNADKIREDFESIRDIYLKLYEVPRVPLTTEETYRLREALVSIGVHNEMTQVDLAYAKDRTTKNRIKKLFHRK